MPESIDLFLLCEGMKWSHLPVAGGLYDQDPRLLAQWRIIFTRRAQREKAKQAQDAARRK